MTGDALSRLAAWRAGGSFIEVPCGTGSTGAHRLWTRVSGDGDAWLTLLHGFPTSSFDMAAVASAMSVARRVLALDMIGFGESDRPAAHEYCVVEQADAVCLAWARYGVRETAVFAHDLGASVAQELLWRAGRGDLPVQLRCVVLANGGIYPDLHRPLPAQTALADPEHGASVSAALTEELMTQSLLATFGPAHQPSPDELHAMWSTISRHDGHRNLHLLIRYMDERRAREADWVGALESTRVPLGFVWGMLDPISGAHIASRIVERFPSAPRRLLDDVGHWPPLEAPDDVVAVLREVDAAQG
jgi:pimeloyl-ACP methyl ester carboxylesterase